VSSIRSKNFPPVFLAKSQLNSAVLAPPTCKYPVGDGANLTLVSFIILSFSHKNNIYHSIAASNLENKTEKARKPC
jgi:hypothetical protein